MILFFPAALSSARLLGSFYCILYLGTTRPKVRKKKITISSGIVHVCAVSYRGLWTVGRCLLPALPSVPLFGGLQPPWCGWSSGWRSCQHNIPTSLCSLPLVPSNQQRSEGRRRFPVPTPVEQPGDFFFFFLNCIYQQNWNHAGLQLQSLMEEKKNVFFAPHHWWLQTAP